MTEVPVPDEEVEAAAEAMFAAEMEQYGIVGHQQGFWRAECYRLTRAALAAVRPAWEKQLAELRSENDRLVLLIDRQLGDCIGCVTEPDETCPRDGRSYGEWVHIASEVIGRQHVIEAERDAARAELERVREHADLMRQSLQEVADMWTGRDAFMPIPAIERARAAAGLPEQPKERQ